MKVLLIVYDLYKEIGGGQTVYRNIIEQTPEVEFFYLRREEVEQTPRPANAQSILVKKPDHELVFNSFLPDQIYDKGALIHADSIAYTVAGMEFDVVDIPDFFEFGSYLRMVFAEWGVKTRSIVLAMHGRVSTSTLMNWGNEDGADVFQQILLENTQYVVADGVYSLSLFYMEQWQKKYKRKIHYIDPLCFVKSFVCEEIVPWEIPAQTEEVDLCSIGRGERGKGIDLFIEMVPWLHTDSYREVKHIGDVCYTQVGSSNDLLHDIASKREVSIDLLGSLTHTELQELFSQRNIVFLLSRCDTLNLLALEALFSGCPTVISSYAGVCKYLDIAHPGLPYIKFDMENFYSSIEQVQDLIDNYDVHRCKLTDYLVEYQSEEKPILNMRHIYEQTIKDTPIYLQQTKYSNSYKIKTHTKSFNEKRDEYLNQFHFYLNRIIFRKALFEFEDQIKFFIQEYDKVTGILKSMGTYLERDMCQLYDRAEFLYAQDVKVVFRCNLFLEAARLERLKGDGFLAAAYELRVLRLLGEDRMNLLPRVCGALRKHGKENEAEVAELMYASKEPKEKMNGIYGYLQGQYEKHRNYEEKSFSLMDDRRAKHPVKVSVIVSLYNAADKLTLFLSALSRQSLLGEGEVEIILIDSDSPGEEKAVLDDFLKEKSLNVLYARTEESETIQTVWNRGILLSRGQYLYFMGVDETIYPQGFEILADELDANPEIDWVMSNTLVTQVEKSGLFKKDVMVYDRTGGQKTDTYLETCYLGCVGGMYRRSVHERFGYYDGSFEAAGDTEFKNRVLPHIQVKFLPVTLAIFLDYPEDRKTASCLAEIEDLRAWYLHRTVGGIRYAFSEESMSNIEALLLRSMSYRKSYCQHNSMDIEYAINLGRYIISRVDDAKDLQEKCPQITRTVELLEQFLTSLREIEFSESSQVSKMVMSQKTLRLPVLFQKLKQELCVLSPTFSHLSLERFSHDNRYEQHFWFWPVLPYDDSTSESEPSSQVLNDLIPKDSRQELIYALSGGFSFPPDAQGRGEDITKLIVLTIPKSGTHLLAEFLMSLGLINAGVHLNGENFSCRRDLFQEKTVKKETSGRQVICNPLSKSVKLVTNGQFAVGHIGHSAEYEKHLDDFTVIFGVRELRSVFVSWLRRLYAHNKSMVDYSKGQQQEREWRELDNPRQRMQVFLKIHGEFLFNYIKPMTGWVRYPQALIVCFEDLTTAGKYNDTCWQISRKIGLDITQEEAIQALESVLGKGTATWSGKLSSLEEYWSDEAEEIFCQLGGDEMNRELGYPEALS